MSVLVLLGKPDCGLCREMRGIVEKVALELGHSFHERDVTGDPELERRYVLEIPVLLMDGREIARHRITAVELRERLTTTSTVHNRQSTVGGQGDPAE